MKKTNFLFLFIISLGLISFAACSDDDDKIQVEKVALVGDFGKTAVNLEVGGVLNLEGKYEVTPANAINTSVTVIGVDGKPTEPLEAGKKMLDINGLLIKANAAGTAKVRIVSRNNPNAKVEFDMVIVDALVAVTGISFTEKAISLGIGGTANLTKNLITFLPADATNKEVTFKLKTASDVVTLADSTLTAVKAGTAVIVATAVDNDKITAELTITVKADVVVPVVITVADDAKAIELDINAEFDLAKKVTVTPAGTKLTYTVSPASDAITVVNGLIKAVKATTAPVTVKIGVDGDTSVTPVEVTVTVKEGAVEPTLVWADRAAWAVNPSHRTVYPKVTDVNDVGLFGTAASLIDGDDVSVMTLVKPGKSFDTAVPPLGEGEVIEKIVVGADEKIGFTIDMKAATKFNTIYVGPRAKGGVVGLLLKTIKLEGSNDGATFTLIQDNVEIPLITSTPRVSEPVVLTATHEYKFIKVTYIDYHGTTGSTAQVSEFKVGL